MKWRWPKGKALSDEHRDAISKGAKATTHNSGRFQQKSHCKNGHVIDRTSKRYLQCRDCQECHKGSGVKRKYYTPVEYLLREYQDAAKERNFVWELTFEQFQILIFSPCHYTGRLPSRKRTQNGETILFNGIDRLDNTLGYIWSNCVPCCTEVNMMKKNLGYDQFIQLCKEVTQPKVETKDSPTDVNTRCLRCGRKADDYICEKCLLVETET